MIGGKTNNKPFPLDDFDTQSFIRYRQADNCSIEPIMEQFIQKWRCIVVRELDSGSRNESLLQLGRFLANLFVDKWAASNPQYLCFAELDRFEGSDCFITRLKQVSENYRKRLTRFCDLNSAAF